MSRELGGGDLHSAAVGMRRWAESRFGGHWESVASWTDVGFAAYKVDSFYCKLKEADGRTAVLWKVMQELR